MQEVNLKVRGSGAGPSALTPAISRCSNWNQFTHKPRKTGVGIRLLPVCSQNTGTDSGPEHAGVGTKELH